MTKRRHSGSIYLQAVKQRESVIDWMKDPGPYTQAWFNHWRQQSLEFSTSASFPVDRSGADTAREVALRVSASEIFYVSDEVAQVILEASQQMPAHLMDSTDFPSTHGWVHFEKTLNFYPASGHTLKLDSFLWSREHVGRSDQDSGPGFLLWDFENLNNWDDAYRNDTTEEVLNELRKELGTSGLFPSAFGSARDGRVPWICRDLDDLEADPTKMVERDIYLNTALGQYYAGRTERPFPMGAEVLKSGEEDGLWHFKTKAGNRVLMMPDPLCRWLQAFFAFLAQKLPALDVNQMPMPHTYLQRYRHKNINGEPITIVTWRRRQESDHQEGSGRALHFRHVRRGHWRRSRRKINGEWAIYPIWIHPTLVGNPELPFKTGSTVVNKVSR